MELWVRSQDKSRLLKVNNIRIKLGYFGNNYENYTMTDYFISNDNSVYEKYDIYIYNDDIELGQYKTKERALEILDDIQSKIGMLWKFPKDFQFDEYVYEMPKE